jgi:hypothetical protein
MSEKNETFPHGNSKALSADQEAWLRAIIKETTTEAGVESIENPGTKLDSVNDLSREIGASKLALLSAACGLGVSLSQHKLIGLFVSAYVKRAATKQAQA